jgi:hypothetical protein
LRAELEAQFGPEYERWIEKLGAMRRALFARRIDPRRRTHMLQRLASRQRYERFLRLERRRTGGSA